MAQVSLYQILLGRIAQAHVPWSTGIYLQDGTEVKIARDKYGNVDGCVPAGAIRSELRAATRTPVIVSYRIAVPTNERSGSYSELIKSNSTTTTQDTNQRNSKRNKAKHRMPTVYEARCLNCGNLGHYKMQCPRIPCLKCHKLGHTAASCNVEITHVSFDHSYIIDRPKKEDKDEEEHEDDHLEDYYAS